MKALVPIFVLLSICSTISLPALAAGTDYTGRDTLLSFGARLRGQEKVIHYTGVDQKGELCELTISKDQMVYSHTQKDFWVGSDSIFNPYYAFMADGRSIEKNAVTSDVLGNRETSTIAISSTEDSSRVEITVVHNKNEQGRFGGTSRNQFVSGFIKYDRGTPQICNFKLETVDRTERGEHLLTEIRRE